MFFDLSLSLGKVFFKNFLDNGTNTTDNTISSISLKYN